MQQKGKMPKKKIIKKKTVTREELLKIFYYHQKQAEECNSPGILKHHMEKMDELLHQLNEMGI
jgi:hypothetical protein